jgi:RecJ-like exonuclease
MEIVKCPMPGCMGGTLYITGGCTVCHGRGVVYDEQGRERLCPVMECVEGKVTAEFVCPLCDGRGFVLVI